MKSITIVVPCRNEKKSIGKLLDSIAAQDMTGLDWQVTVADGMSDDGTRELVLAYAAREPRVRVLDNPGRIVSTGLNEAIRQASGEIILRMDAHTEYAPDYVRTCVEALERTGAGNVGGPARTRAKGFWPVAIAAAYQSAFACGGARFHNPDFEGWVDTVPYGCWRKQTLMELGGFDDALVRNQDDELNLRLVRAGLKIWQTPSIVSWYHPRSSISTLARQYFQYGFWKVAVIGKHRLPASWRHLVPVAWLLANVVLLLNAIVAPLLGWTMVAAIGGWLWALAWLLYLLAAGAAAFQAASRHGWQILPVLPFVFAVYHFSYGAGFLCGLLYWPFAKNTSGGAPGKYFTQLTR